LKAGYDLTLWAWFRRVPLPATQPPPAGTATGADADAVEELP
jgi:hypothetical protein